MNIEKFCTEFDLGNVLNITKLTGGLMHKMFKVKTNKGIYCIKVLNPEVMSREEAYDNFVLAEKISNFAKEKGIPVSNALTIKDNFINKFDGYYYMVFDFVNGKVLTDDEITVNHCKKIGNILAKLHSLDYKEIGLESNITEYKRLYDWESYINNPNFNNMPYKELYLVNYKKYNSMLKRANERFNDSNKKYAICHRDMDPKNVMWDNDNPIIIDWECAGVSNPERELLEDALCWSGFLSNNFDEDKFTAFIKEYTKIIPFEHNRYNTICGNLVGRFGWLKYNLERSLGIVSNEEEEINLAKNEVIKTIDEINRYLDLIGPIYDILCNLTKKEMTNYDKYIKKIVESNEFLKGLSYKRVNAGFTNTIYRIDNYIIRLCTDINNEDRFKNEIDFYNKNKANDKIPKLYHYDITKEEVPFFYEVIEYVKGKTLYEIWYKLNEDEKKDIVIKIIDILKSFHSIKTEEYNYSKYIKDIINSYGISCTEIDKLLILCDKYFKENKFGIVHADLHFDNFIYDGNKLNLLDFERYIKAPIDYDFRIFYQSETEPWLWASASTDMLAVEPDYQGLMNMFIENYDELKDIKYLKERLEVYYIIDLLKKYKNLNDEAYLNRAKEKINILK